MLPYLLKFLGLNVNVEIPMHHSSKYSAETRAERSFHLGGAGALRTLPTGSPYLFERTSAKASYWSVAMKSTPASIAACQRNRACASEPKL